MITEETIFISGHHEVINNLYVPYGYKYEPQYKLSIEWETRYYDERGNEWGHAIISEELNSLQEHYWIYFDLINFMRGSAE